MRHLQYCVVELDGQPVVLNRVTVPKGAHVISSHRLASRAVEAKKAILRSRERALEAELRRDGA